MRLPTKPSPERHRQAFLTLATSTCTITGPAMNPRCPSPAPESAPNAGGPQSLWCRKLEEDARPPELLPRVLDLLLWGSWLLAAVAWLVVLLR